MLEGLVPGLPRDLSARHPRSRRGRPPLRGRNGPHAAGSGVARPRRAAGTWSPGTIEDLEVPETLHALVGGPPGQPRRRGRARARAAPGRRRARPVVHRRRRWRRSAVAPSRRSRGCSIGLVAKQVLGRDDDPRSPERGQYVFLQALLRTVALRHAVAPRRARPATSPPPQHLRADLAGRGRARSPRCWPATISSAVEADPDADDADAIRGPRARDAGRRRAPRRIAGARAPRRAATSNVPRRSPATRCERAELARARPAPRPLARPTADGR